MKTSPIIEELATLLEKQRQDLNNGSDYQDAEAIMHFLLGRSYLHPTFNKNSNELIEIPEIISDNYRNQADGIIG